MSLSLPLSGSDLRGMFDVADLADRNWCTLSHAKHSAKRTFANQSGIVEIIYIVLRANDSVHLMAFGPRGGKRILWNFGKAPV